MRRLLAYVVKDKAMNQTELLHQHFPHLRELKPFTSAHHATPWLADMDAKQHRKLCESVEQAVGSDILFGGV